MRRISNSFCRYFFLCQLIESFTLPIGWKTHFLEIAYFRFDKALTYQPDLKPDTAELYLKKGFDLMNQGSVEASIIQFEVAAKYYLGLKTKFAELC